MVSGDYTAIVDSIKKFVVARGVDLKGPCGAFEITKRVAWFFRETGAGLHAKYTGERCGDYNSNIVIWQDGQYVDCLVDAGGANTPAWQLEQGDGIYWRPPVDPGDAVAPAPVPSPTPAPAPDPSKPDPRLEQLALLLPALERIEAGLDATVAALATVDGHLSQLVSHGVKVHL